MIVKRVIPIKMRPPIYDIASLARYITSPDCQSVMFFTGAGISTASGIPDFRSPSGLYDTLRPELITATEEERESMRNDPQQVVSWDLFKKNAFPYLEVRRPFILGTNKQQWKATIAHRFMELLHTKSRYGPNTDKSKLLRIYTQNIDSLDYQCTLIPREKIVSVHGTIREVECERCHKSRMKFKEFCTLVQSNIIDIYNMDSTAPEESKPILCTKCGRPYMKPKTVLFGRPLPEDFYTCFERDMATDNPIDILFIVGTSLQVSPANQIVPAVAMISKYQPINKRTIRVIVNREPVGTELGIRYGNTPLNDDNDEDYDSNNPDTIDLFFQGDCDDIFLQLIVECGWLDDFVTSYMNHSNDDSDEGVLLPPSSIERIRKAQRDTEYQKWF